jgi:hypothetical protein
MPIAQDPIKSPAYKPSKEDAKLVLDVIDRIRNLKQHRTSIEANPYDKSPNARSIEDTWNFCDYVSLPHKFWNVEMQSWMADNAHPLILSKIDTAVSILAAKNPEVELVARSDKFEAKTKILEALYSLSWDKGQGRQQLIKFINTIAKYGTAIGREYHLYRKREVTKIVSYDPDEGKHIVEKEEVIDNDEPYFETLPIRDVWIDNRAKPYDEYSIRDWCWTKVYDYSTFLIDFPAKKYPEAQYIVATGGNNESDYDKDLGDVSDDIPGDKVRLWFYEDLESNEFIITDGLVLLYRGPLLGNQLSLVVGMWKMRNEQTIYGIGLPEILENSDEMLNRIVNMVQNQIMISIGGAGFYGGVGNVNEQDMILEPKLKKLRDVDKIVFPKIPAPDPMVLSLIEYIENRADEYSGVTKALTGEQVGKTLGEAVLNREAGLRRLQTPLQNIEFALERQGRLRIDLIQLVYGRPQKTHVVVDEFGAVIDPKLLQEFNDLKAQVGPDSMELIQKFPQVEGTPQMFKNEFKTERLGVQKDTNGEYTNSEQDQLIEILPAEIQGSFDVRVRAYSTIPVSQAMEQQKTAEIFQMISQMPYTDIYKAEKRLLKTRKEKPEDWMMDEQAIQDQQAQADQAKAEQQMAGDQQAAQGQEEKAQEQAQAQAQQGTQDQKDQAQIALMQQKLEQQGREAQVQPATQDIQANQQV